MNYNILKNPNQVLNEHAKDALYALEHIADALSVIPFDSEIQHQLNCITEDVADMDALIGAQADKIDELEDDLRFAETEKQDAETEQSRLEDRLDELKQLPESILNHFDRNPHLMEDLRNLAAALRFDNQHANAELIAQTVSVLESIQITAA